ncbi:MAG: DUF262 domain-containing HNH endonuclease family protein [Bacteroidales bacterium]|nr:DUF262 domain-containing HNH endonuclease family protein [Bacteroidales bacterium]
MANINIEKAFVTDNKSVYLYLSMNGQGLYIPLYQRDYSWDRDNIIQLQEDIESGISRIVNTQDEQEIRFLGTIITLVESNREKIYPIEPQIVPSRVEVLIDGQQRLSTIIVFSTILLRNLFDIKEKLNKLHCEFFDEINDIYDFWEDKLKVIYTVEIRRQSKPKIIRGNRDFWTEKESSDKAYKSFVSFYLAKFIESYSDNFNKPFKPTAENIGKNLFTNFRTMEKWISETVRKAHLKNEDFPAALSILDKFNRIDLLNDEREAIVDFIKENDFMTNKISSCLCEYIQVLSVCHYLLERCCFTVIQPTDENWAFDMFQSLNATGTPLTAIETFKPRVVNITNDRVQGFKNSKNEEYFNKIDQLFEGIDSAQIKNTRTKDFLTSFFVAYNGQQVSSHFSHQRKSLIDAFEDRKDTDEMNDFRKKSEFIEFLGNYAEFYRSIWLTAEKNMTAPFPLFNGYADADLASMLICFLRACNHKMAITVLGNFYDSIQRNRFGAIENFINAVKAISAYYFLWRTASSNAGLDVTYRDLFKTDDKSWKFENGLTLNELKEHLKCKLAEKQILQKTDWISKAKDEFKYENAPNEAIRLGLLIAAHDTIADESRQGLIKNGRAGISNYLCLNQWGAEDLLTIEHIAPQKNDNNWDENIYENKLFQSIGNLTLLPQGLNASAGNRPWVEKILYYKTVGEKDPAKIQSLKTIAQSMNISLNETTISLLQNSKYSGHIEAIARLNQNDNWNKEMIENRRDNLLDIIWEKVIRWLS